MTNYKTEQEKQDERFEEEFYPIDKTDILIDTFKNGIFWGKKETLDKMPSYLLSRDTALLEAFKKDVGDKRDSPPPYPADKNNPLKHCYQNEGYNQALDDILSLLKDYNLNK